jgi:methyltransferase (TIGR00027 family)
MHPREPSRTAFAAAGHRAAHQLLENGRIFADPLAVAILGRPSAEIIEAARARPANGGMRAFIAARSAFAEARLARAVEAGVDQLVVLGAGLDTFAYRNPFGDRLTVFEVDHPATQAWKRERLAAIGAAPDRAVFAAVDFERDDPMERLVAAGFDAARPAFFTWLGVVPYLTREAVFATLAMIGALPGGAAVVFDYSDPPETMTAELRAVREARAARVAALGEPFLSSFDPPDLHAALRGFGLTQIEDLGPAEIMARFVSAERAAKASPRGGHVIYASKPFAPREGGEGGGAAAG